MSYLTRRERDAVIGLVTVFAVSFLSGVFAYRIGDTLVYDYQTAAGLLMLAFLAFLVYRVLRRAAEFGLARFRAGDAA